VSEERQIECVISTEKDLEELVRQALVSGVLDLENCRINVDFNLAELLLVCGQTKVPLENYSWLAGVKCPFSVKCPFIVQANRTCFKQYFSCLSYKTAINFSKGATFRDATFSEQANFWSTTFSEQVDFWNTTFSQEPSFSFATFSKEATFRHATFSKGANFNSAIFSEWATFRDATFSELASFSFATFSKEAFFSFATFSKEAFFRDATFVKKTSFKEVHILENATLIFDHITTHDYLGIIPSELNGEIIIKDPRFESDKRSLVVDLEQCSPESKGIVSFKNIEMDEKKTCIKLRNLKSDSGVKVHFTDCNFHGENVVLRHVDFEKINIEGGTLAKGFDFGYLDPTPLTITLGCLGFPIHCQFQAIHKNRKLPENKLKMWASIYANLKAKADEKGERQLGNDYFFWQQYFQRVEHQPPFCNFNEIYLCSSTYGLNFKLPLFYFTAYLFAFALFYMMTALHSFREGFLVSLSASIPFVFNDIDTIQNTIALIAIKENWWWFYPLYILQHLIQGYLLFQIGAAIRNKVKR
jgi:hypothetical protein